MSKHMTIGIELPDDADYPDVNFGSVLLTGRVVSASVYDVMALADAMEERLGQISNIAWEVLEGSELSSEFREAIQKIQRLSDTACMYDQACGVTP